MKQYPKNKKLFLLKARCLSVARVYQLRASESPGQRCNPSQTAKERQHIHGINYLLVCISKTLIRVHVFENELRLSRGKKRKKKCRLRSLAETSKVSKIAKIKKRVTLFIREGFQFLSFCLEQSELLEFCLRSHLLALCLLLSFFSPYGLKTHQLSVHFAPVVTHRALFGFSKVVRRVRFYFIFWFLPTSKSNKKKKKNVPCPLLYGSNRRMCKSKEKTQRRF